MLFVEYVLLVISSDQFSVMVHGFGRVTHCSCRWGSVHVMYEHITASKHIAMSVVISSYVWLLIMATQSHTPIPPQLWILVSGFRVIDMITNLI